MSRSDPAESESKFTRGEKCLFVHLVVTFIFILILIIVYFVHLCLIQHSAREAVTISRRSGAKTPDHPPVGFLYLNIKPIKPICNTMLLTDLWSLAPAHCTVIRSDPDMAHLWRTWKIKYQKNDNEYIESEIKRSIPHPHFNRDDFSYNIGLFQHEDPISIYTFIFPEITINDETLQEHANGMDLVGWQHSNTVHKDGSATLTQYNVRPVLLVKCQRFMTPLVDLRSYEFCVLLNERQNFPDHGAVFRLNSKKVGFFAWGDKRGKVPSIIINIMHFKSWIEDVISLYRIITN